MTDETIWTDRWQCPYCLEWVPRYQNHDCSAKVPPTPSTPISDGRDNQYLDMDVLRRIADALETIASGIEKVEKYCFCRVPDRSVFFYFCARCCRPIKKEEK